METPDLSTLSDNIDSTDDLVPSLQVLAAIQSNRDLPSILDRTRDGSTLTVAPVATFVFS